MLDPVEIMAVIAAGAICMNRAGGGAVVTRGNTLAHILTSAASTIRLTGYAQASVVVALSVAATVGIALALMGDAGPA